YLPLRRETFEREAVYTAIGIKLNGHKEVIDYCIAPSENIKVWTEMLQNMKFRGLKQVEPDLLVFYNYPKQIRASIYSTNMIESFNNVIKRKAKPKAEFPTEQSLDTFIGIQAMSYNDRYFNRLHKGFGQVQDTLESYFD
uniref:transposase n=1 Tax=Lactobacillus crispatus TaxID=47770 RepID=UPI0022E14C08